MATTPPPRLVLDDTLGALLLGTIIAAALWGVTAVQTWSYYIHYPKDMWYIKALVAVVFVLDTIHQGFIIHTVYWYLITNFSVPTELGNIVWTILAETVPNALTTMLVQGFLTYRAWLLSNKNVFLVGFLSLLVLAQFALSMAFTVLSLQLETFQQLKGLKRLPMSINTVSAAGDIVIAGTLCFLLHKSRTGFRKSDSMINKLMVFAINTGLLTSVVASLVFITLLVYPNAFIYAALYFSVGRLYANSLLATLNARKISHRGTDDPETLSISFLDSMTRTAQRSKGPNISIQIDTTKDTHDDIEALPKKSLN